MSIINSPLLLTGADTGYRISRSLRFNSADSAYLSRTPASAGNRRTWTFSCWIKRAKLGEFTSIIVCMDSGASHYFQFVFETDDTLSVYDTNVAGSTKALQTSRVFRDVSAWYHLVLYYNTTQSTAANKAKLYVNGVEETAFSTDNRSSLTADSSMNRADQHSIGSRQPYSGSYLNAYLADIWFLDGIAATPSDFAATDATTGQWSPKAYAGSKSGNSFHLEFADNSAATAAALGKDAAGSNNWTPNNFSVTAGAGNDSLVDTPTSYGTDTSLGGEVRGNYCTWNPLKKGAAITDLTNGNLDWLSTTVGSNYTSMVLGTIGVSSGKWYWENTIGSQPYVGVGIATDQVNLQTYPGGDAFSWTYFYNAAKYNNGASASYGASFTTGDVIGVALDLDSGTLTFYKNGVSQGSAYSGLSGPTYFPMSGDPNSSTNGSLTANFGQRPWAYTPPANYRPLVDTLLPTPVVAKPNTVFDTVLWTGNDTGQTITLPGAFSPDLVWTKTRSALNNHWLFDVIRGANQGLSSSSTTNELTRTNSVTAFGSTGFTLGTSADVNSSAYTYVAWAWDAGTSTATNTQGSITSQVRTNGYLSIVGYTGNGSSGATVGHGGLVNLDKGMIIIKKRTSSPGNTNWRVYHSALGNTQAIYLSDTGAATSGSGFWNNTSPTSTVFTLGSDDGLNASSQTHIAYCFAPVAGYSSFGSYTGNGSSDGPFVFCNFRPRWVMVKSSDWAGGNWVIIDAARDTYNVTTKYLGAEGSYAEQTLGLGALDILSNGFKLKYPYDSTNRSATTFIYAAFAESPFQYARAR